jgi:O-antigen ligase
MPPLIAAVFCFILIAYLFWLDRAPVDGVSRAAWIPLLWMFPAASRFFSQWLDLGAELTSPTTEAYLEGSPLDRTIFLIIMAAGAVVLILRRLDWSKLITRNALILAFFAFGALSIAWSDYSFVAFKRWVKAFGNVIIILILLTEERPYEALGVVLRRLAYVLLPLSVLFVKYYPLIGRSFHRGSPMFHGVTIQKNSLGMICLVFGIYFCWKFLSDRWSDSGPKRPLPAAIYLVMLPMIGWLIYKADSATSQACLMVAVFILALSQLPPLAARPRSILGVLVVLALFFGLLEALFGVKDAVITMLGREPHLTTRVPMWLDLLAMVQNPFIGFGFESFWLGERQEAVREAWRVTMQAHNGYIEMYLNLGLIGLFFMAAWILSGFKTAARHLALDYPAGVLRLCIVVAVVLYNWTEATFYGVSLMWMMFFFATLQTPESEPSERLYEPDGDSDSNRFGNPEAAQPAKGLRFE